MGRGGGTDWKISEPDRAAERNRTTRKGMKGSERMERETGGAKVARKRQIEARVSGKPIWAFLVVEIRSWRIIGCRNARACQVRVLLGAARARADGWLAGWNLSVTRKLETALLTHYGDSRFLARYVNGTRLARLPAASTRREIRISRIIRDSGECEVICARANRNRETVIVDTLSLPEVNCLICI